MDENLDLNHKVMTCKNGDYKQFINYKLRSLLITGGEYYKLVIMLTNALSVRKI